MSKIFSRGVVVECLFVLACLAFFYCLGHTSLVKNSPTMDEPVYLVGGISYWRNNDFRLNPEAGILPQLWEALPAALSEKVSFPRTDGYFKFEDQVDISTRYFAKMGNDMGFILNSGRVMVLLASLAAGVVVYLWARRIFGVKGAAVALLLFCFFPSVIAHASLATSDMFVTLFFLLSLYFAERAFRKMTPLALAATALSLAGLFLSKYSAFFIVPVYLVMMMARISSSAPLMVSFFGRRLLARNQAGKLLACVVFSAVAALAVYSCIWAAYGFRFSSVAEGDAMGRRFMDEVCWGRQLDEESGFHRLIGEARDRRILPEAYLYGFLYTFESSKGRDNFLNGSHNPRGWWYFFPYCFAVKSPLPFLLLLGLCCLGPFVCARTRLATTPRRWLLKISTPIVFIAVFMLFAMTSRINIGERHVLPIYPFLFILAGSAGLWLGRRDKLFSAAAVVLVCACVFCGIATWPHYLSHFNILAGGPSNGYKHLVDSSLDWGQDNYRLKSWLEERGLQDEEKARRVFISFFSPVSTYYLGIKGRILPSFQFPIHKGVCQLTGGTYCFSVTTWQLVVFPTLRKAWTEEEDRLYKFFDESLRGFIATGGDRKTLEEKFTREQLETHFRNYMIYDLMRFKKLVFHLHHTKRPPDARIAHTILVFNLSDEEVADILAKPPPNLFENCAAPK